jgi:hypothetical protein
MTLRIGSTPIRGTYNSKIKQVKTFNLLYIKYHGPNKKQVLSNNNDWIK